MPNEKARITGPLSVSNSEQATQHPGGFLVHLHALGQQIGSRLVADLVQQWENAARSAYDGLLALHQ